MSTKTAAPRQLKLGTRASPLALWQSRHVAAALCAAHGWPDDAIAFDEIITKGDQRLDLKLAEIGGKGLFTEELESGLRAKNLDLAVHSLKDLPTANPPGLVLGAILPRADMRDVLICRAGLPVTQLADLPPKAKIGTASLRRAAQLRHQRPDIVIEPLRGNVATRLKKLETEGLDATLLAAAGLERLGLTLDTATPLDPREVLPAAGQGALAVQCRADDKAMLDWLAPLHCAATYDCVTAERAFLAALDGSCRTPIAALAQIKGGHLFLTGRLLSEDGTQMVEAAGDGARADAVALGIALADQVRHDMQDQAAHAKNPQGETGQIKTGQATD